MKQRMHRRGGAMSVDREFVRTLEDQGWGGTSAQRQGVRKTNQFCRQVQRALNLALADLLVDGDIGELYVEDVTPAPDCGHLLAHVVVPAERDIRGVLQALGRHLPRLRCEVASSISRKRAPELTFVPAFMEGGADE